MPATSKGTVSSTGAGLVPDVITAVAVEAAAGGGALRGGGSEAAVAEATTAPFSLLTCVLLGLGAVDGMAMC